MMGKHASRSEAGHCLCEFPAATITIPIAWLLELWVRSVKKFVQSREV